MQKETQYDYTRQKHDFDGLWETADVRIYTGWSRQYISKLCSENQIPYIPGRPNKFVPSSLRKAIEDMQVGGRFGRRKPKKTQSRKTN